MKRILIKQGDKYIPSTDEDLKGMGGPLGRGSDVLKKKWVYIGDRYGSPVYELRSLTESDTAGAAASPTPSFRPAPGPMSAVKDPLEPYRSQTPIPEFNLGISGSPAAPTPTPRPVARNLGAQDPVARKKAQEAATRASVRTAIRKPLAAAKPQPKLRQDTDAKRRSEEQGWMKRYLAPTAPKPEPLDLSLPPTPEELVAKQPKPDPLERYKVPVSSRESELPPDDFSKNDLPEGDWVTTEGTIGKTPERRVQPSDQATGYGDNPNPTEGETEPTTEPEGTPAERPEGIPLEGKLDEAGGGMWARNRDFNGSREEGMNLGADIGELPATEVAGPSGTTRLPVVGRGHPMETNDTESTQTQTRGVKDEALLNEAKATARDARTKQAEALKNLENTIETQRGTDEASRAKFAQDRQNLLAKYTAGLDDTARARFVDTLVKNIGKIVSGGVGLKKDLDVASNYRYEGADTEGMRKDVEGAYKAGVEDLEAREKERKGAADKEFERRQAILKATIDLPAAQNALAKDLLDFETLVKTEGTTRATAGWSDEKMAMAMDEINRQIQDAAAKRDFEKQKLWVDLLNIAAGIYNTKTRSKAAESVAATQAKGMAENRVNQEKKEEIKKGETTKPEDVIRQRAAVGEISSIVNDWMASDKMFAGAMGKGDVETAKRLLRSRMDRLITLAEQGKEEGKVARIRDARTTFDQLAPRITSTQDLQNLLGTYEKLLKDQASGLGETRAEQSKSESQGNTESKGSTVRIQGPVGALPSKSVAPKSEEEIKKLREIMARHPDEAKRKWAEQSLRDAGLL